jgi:hypothetical protein
MRVERDQACAGAETALPCVPNFGGRIGRTATRASTPIGQLDLHEKAAQLAQKYTAIFGTRPMDLLHIAAAILLGASQLLSFDERQRQAAKREGLKLRPASFRFKPSISIR